MRYTSQRMARRACLGLMHPVSSMMATTMAAAAWGKGASQRVHCMPGDRKGVLLGFRQHTVGPARLGGVAAPPQWGEGGGVWVQQCGIALYCCSTALTRQDVQDLQGVQNEGGGDAANGDGCE